MEKTEKEEETSDNVYKVVEVTATVQPVIEYPDGKKYTFEAATLDALERIYKLEKKVG